MAVGSDPDRRLGAKWWPGIATSRSREHISSSGGSRVPLSSERFPFNAGMITSCDSITARCGNDGYYGDFSTNQLFEDGSTTCAQFFMGSPSFLLYDGVKASSGQT